MKNILGLSVFMAMAVVFFGIAVGAPVSFASQTIGTASIHAPAVILENNSGILTVISLTVTKGTGIVTISGPSEVGNSTLESAQTAAVAAANYLGINYKDYNFEYVINDSANVSGPSAGTAMALLAISALSHRQMIQNFTVTGTISPNDSIGEIGGVYDKISAASKDGMKFALVPKVPQASFENELYYLTQETFNIPLVQVSNLSAAVKFVFNYNGARILSNQTTYTPYTNYHVNEIPNATIQCSNGCNILNFINLVSFTFNITESKIQTVGSSSNFANLAAQLNNQLNESKALAKKGYLYLGADLSFIDYINAFYFANHNTTKSGALETINNVSNYCNAITPPSMTNANYNYVLGGELRQEWGIYTITNVLNSYNATAVDTDGILDNIYAAGEANAWCSAAQQMYNIAGKIGGTNVYSTPAIEALANSSIKRASNYGGMYLSSAESAYGAGNYPAAIIDADYAYALGSSYNMNTSALLDNAAAIANNSTYGVWATQFSNEAMFYVKEANLPIVNATQQRSYAESAYSTALLAHMISIDTSKIYNNFTTVPSAAVTTIPTTIPTTVPATIPITITPSTIPSTQGFVVLGLKGLLLIIFALLIIILIMVVVILVLVAIQFSLMLKQGNKKRR